MKKKDRQHPEVVEMLLQSAGCTNCNQAVLLRYTVAFKISHSESSFYFVYIFDSNRNDTRCEMPRQLISGEKWEWQRYGQRLLDMNVHTPLIPEKVLTSKENDNYTDLVLHHPLPPPPPQVYQREKYFSCNVLQK